MSISLIDEFNSEMLGLFKRTGDSIGYWPRYFLRKVKKVGGLKMAKDLLDDTSKATGFGRLAKEKKLDLSVEYLVLQPKWWLLFTDRERDIARNRLRKAGFDRIPDEARDYGNIVYFNNCRNRPHQELFQLDAFFDLNATGVQASQAVGLPIGQDCVVATKPSSTSATFTWFSFASEKLMPERGSGPHAPKYRVFLGNEIFSETVPLSQASKEPLYSPFFDKNGRFKQWSTISRAIAQKPDSHASQLFEGTERRVIGTVYERNPAARKRCIDHHGTTCFVCGFDFLAFYGVTAKGYIHIHHKKPLSEIKEKYLVDPVNDLAPVCPNCHAVIHLGGTTRTIEEVKKLVELAKKSVSS